MANDTRSYLVFSISDDSGFGIPPQKDKDGCWPCRFRKKRCAPDPSTHDSACLDCRKFNMRCTGQGIDRPSELGLAEKVRAATKPWIGDRTNRIPSVAPLDLSYLWNHLRSVAPAPAATPAATLSPDDFSPAPDLDLDGASAITTPSLFPTSEASPRRFEIVPQETYITHTVSSHHHDAAVPRSSQQRIDASVTDPQDIIFSLHDQFPDHRRYLPYIWSEDHDNYRGDHAPPVYFPDVPFLLPYGSGDVPSHSPSPGSYNTFGDPAESHSHGEARYVTPEQLLLVNLNKTNVPWGHPQVYR